MNTALTVFVAFWAFVAVVIVLIALLVRQLIRTDENSSRDYVQFEFQPRHLWIGACWRYEPREGLDCVEGHLRRLGSDFDLWICAFDIMGM